MARLDDRWDPDAAASAEGGLFGLPHTPDDAAVVVLPVPWEATCSYRLGTARAPEAIREASLQVDLLDLDTGEPWREGIAMEAPDELIERLHCEAFPLARGVVEAGGVIEPAHRYMADNIAELTARLHQRVREWALQVLDRGAIPGVLGGEHGVPFGAIQAASERVPGLAVLHIDAHADLRVAFEGLEWSHASIMDNVLSRLPQVSGIVQVGIRDLGHAERDRIAAEPRLTTFFDRDLAWGLAQGRPWGALAAEIVAALPDKVWISLDIDGLEPALCPTTGTPVPGGLSWHQLTVLLRVLGESGRQIVGFDLCEVGPEPWDADVGARVLYKLAGWAIATRAEVPR
ncbi:MAG: agmatinase family protein [Deltaproteobacteria bacterium]|nr:agmatinase family protein [Deltaproteobacteria bacterium]